MSLSDKLKKSESLDKKISSGDAARQESKQLKGEIYKEEMSLINQQELQERSVIFCMMESLLDKEENDSEVVITISVSHPKALEKFNKTYKSEVKHGDNGASVSITKDSFCKHLQAKRNELWQTLEYFVKADKKLAKHQANQRLHGKVDKSTGEPFDEPKSSFTKL